MRNLRRKDSAGHCKHKRVFMIIMYYGMCISETKEINIHNNI